MDLKLLNHLLLPEATRLLSATTQDETSSRPEASWRFAFENFGGAAGYEFVSPSPKVGTAPGAAPWARVLFSFLFVLSGTR